MPDILVVTGASGVGKTTLLRALEREKLPGIACYYFDALGVPSSADMKAQFGSPAAWQAATSHRWIAHLVTNTDGAKTAILEGQIRPSEARAAFAEFRVRRTGILLIDCDHPIREARLRGERSQPELASPQMAAWAAYLRGQADALGLPILDTTSLTLAQSTSAFIHWISDWAAA